MVYQYMYRWSIGGLRPFSEEGERVVRRDLAPGPALGSAHTCVHICVHGQNPPVLTPSFTLPLPTAYALAGTLVDGACCNQCSGFAWPLPVAPRGEVCHLA